MFRTVQAYVGQAFAEIVAHTMFKTHELWMRFADKKGRALNLTMFGIALEQVMRAVNTLGHNFVSSATSPTKIQGRKNVDESPE